MSFKKYDKSFFEILLQDFAKEIFKKIGEKNVATRKHEEQIKNLSKK